MKNLILSLVLSAIPCTVLAHEVWLDALEYQVENGSDLHAHLKNGQEFVGSTSIYSDRSFTRFDHAIGDRVSPVEGRIGDRPALQLTAPAEGLNVVVFESGIATVGYKEWEKFAAFAAHKDFRDIRARHDARGLPDADFKEAYSRHVKLLACVGDCTGQDRAFGLATELVALKNPYVDDLSEGLPVQLFYQGKAMPDRQIEVFARASDETVTITLERTNADGIAIIPMQNGVTYLLDAVTLREPMSETAKQRGAVWETLWAALTFQVPN